MPDIYIKDEHGVDVEYDDVSTVTFRQVGGGTITYSIGGGGTKTNNWWMVQSILDAPPTSYAKGSVATGYGTLVWYLDPTFGIWFQSDNDAWQLFNSPPGTSYMYSLDDRYIVFNTNQHLYYYDAAEDTMTDLGVGSLYSSTGSIWNNRNPNYPTKGFCKLINTTQGVYMYADNNFNLVINGGASDIYIYDVEIGIIVSRNVTEGLYFIDKETLQCSKIYDYGTQWGCVLKVDDSTYLISSTSSTGLLSFDTETKTITVLYSSGYYHFPSFASYYQSYRYEGNARSYANQFRLFNDIIFLSTQSSPYLTLKYDIINKTATVVESGTNFYSNALSFSNDEFLSIVSTTANKSIVFNRNTKDTYVINAYCYTASFQQDGIILITNTALQFYDYSTQQLTVLDSNIRGTSYSCTVPGGCLVPSNASTTGISFVDNLTKTVTQLYSSGTWTYEKLNNGLVVCLNSSGNGLYEILFYENGTITGSGATYYYDGRRAINIGEGVFISRTGTNTQVHYISSDKSVTSLLYTMNLGGDYYRDYYGKNNYIPDTAVPVKSFGHYHVLSSPYNYNSFIFDDVNKTQLSAYYWYPDESSPSSTTSNAFSLGNPYCIDIDSDHTLIIPGWGNSSYPTNKYAFVLNHSNGTCYQFVQVPCYITSVYNQSIVQSTVMKKDVSNGFILFFPKGRFETVNGSLNFNYYTCPGVFHLDSSTYKLTQIHSSGYYDSIEEVTGGFYIYLSTMPNVNRLFYDTTTNTITEV